MTVDLNSLQNVQLVREGHLAIVTVNRPAKLNALDGQTIAELDAVFAALDGDASCGAIVLTGAGEKAFIAGADISVLAKQGVLDGSDNARAGQQLTLRIENNKKPVLAAINGWALGGGLEMALACDVRFAAKTAKLGLPEVSLGIIPGYGGTQRLARLCGTGTALQLILTGDPVTADEAMRVGLVNGVFEPGVEIPQPAGLHRHRQPGDQELHLPAGVNRQVQAGLAQFEVEVVVAVRQDLGARTQAHQPH